MSKTQFTAPLADQSDDIDASGAYQFLVDRAQEFVRVQGSTVQEDLLIRHVFGSIKGPEVWRPLFRQVIENAPDLRKRADGTWGFAGGATHSSSLLDEFVAVDVETTGLKPANQRVIEIGLVRFRHGEVVETLSSLCNPERRVPAFISKMTGIQQADVDNAPQFEVIAGRARSFLGDAILIGHNVQFDIRFLNAELKRSGYPSLVNDRLDTMGLSLKLLPGTRRPSLDKVARDLGLPPRTIHRAAGDAELAGNAALVLTQIAADQGIDSLDSLLATASKASTEPRSGVGRARSVLDTSHLDDIPSFPGVYLMRDENRQVIYVGKAKDLKKRVRSYYSQPLGYVRKMDGLVESLAHIDYEVTGTELEALLLEAQLIRKYQPRFNKALRSHEHYPYIRVDIANKWPRIHLATRRRNDGARYFGPYRSRRAAKQTVDLLNDLYPFRTCPRSFKTAKSFGSPCLRLDLGQCLGPCVGKADRDAYMGFIREAVAFLEGDDDLIQGRLQTQLEDAAAREDFESAQKIRNGITTLQSIAGAQRVLTNLENHELRAIVLPSANETDIRLLLVRGSHIWASFDFAKSDTISSVLGRVHLTLHRLNCDERQELDHQSLDEALILGRWLQSNDGHPAIFSIESVSEFAWERLIELALQYSYDSFVSWRPPDEESDGDFEIDRTTASVLDDEFRQSATVLAESLPISEGVQSV